MIKKIFKVLFKKNEFLSRPFNVLKKTDKELEGKLRFKHRPQESHLYTLLAVIGNIIFLIYDGLNNKQSLKEIISDIVKYLKAWLIIFSLLFGGLLFSVIIFLVILFGFWLFE